MNRTPVDSSNLHSVGHDETGLEVQYHSRDCARRRSFPDGDGGSRPGKCDCEGGEVWRYPGVPAELHQKMIAAPSVGSHFTTQIKNAKDAYGFLKYPGVKR